MKKLLVLVPLLVCACRGSEEYGSASSSATGSGGSGGSGVDGGVCPPCPEGTVPRIDDQGQTICVSPECVVDANCPIGWACQDNLCVNVPSCSSDAQCAAPYVCTNGECGQPDCSACPAGTHCVFGVFPDADPTSTGHACVPDTCDDDLDCPAALVCSAGACVEDTTFCDDNTDCPSGVCTILYVTDPGADCNGEPCPAAVGVCVPIGGCATDSDCPANQSCEDGACVDAPPACDSDADCTGGYCNVASGTCIATGDCVNDTDCSTGLVCIAGTCELPPPACTSDASCGPGLRCIDGACVEEEDDGGTCAEGCSSRTGYHLYCASTQTTTASWCPESPVCGDMDNCQASQLASCNAGCPGGCTTTFDGPISCCDCGIEPCDTDAGVGSGSGSGWGSAHVCHEPIYDGGAL
jgi:hypothetical protein